MQEARSSAVFDHLNRILIPQTIGRRFTKAVARQCVHERACMDAWGGVPWMEHPCRRVGGPTEQEQ